MTSQYLRFEMVMMKSLTKRLLKMFIRSSHLVLMLLLLSTTTSLCIDTSYVILSSTGLVKALKVNAFIHAVWLGTLLTNSDVDNFVTRYPDANGIIMTDTRNDFLAVLGYTGYSANKKWGSEGITLGQIKNAIDRFHYHGWKVILCVGFGWANAGFLKSINDELWLYLNNTHRELNFANASGSLRGVQGPDGTGLSDYSYPDYFANYTTPDAARNIPAGASVGELYATRLKQMISDGIQWDGWFGSDGWGGLNIEGFYWLTGYSAYGTADYAPGGVSQWVSGTENEINQWANSSYAPKSFPTSHSGSFSYSTNFDNPWKTTWSVLSGTWMNETDTYISAPNSLGTPGGGQIMNVAANSSSVLNYTMKLAGRVLYSGDSFGAWVRGNNTNSGYSFLIDTYNNVVNIYRAGSKVASASLNGTVHTSWYWIRFVANNTANNKQADIYLRLWLNGAAEPSKWNLTYTDDLPLLAGTFGIWGYSDGARFDNLNVVGNQYVQSWKTMTNSQKSRWIIAYQSTSWYLYWQYRWAELYADINHAFDSRPVEYHFGAMAAMDRSSTWMQSVLGPVGMYNFTDMYDENSFSVYLIQSGGIRVPENSWTAGMLRTKYPEYNVASWAPLWNESWNTKQTWLAEELAYDWNNRTMYRAVQPALICLQTDSNIWLDYSRGPALANPILSWAESMLTYLDSEYLRPIYLGPTYVAPVINYAQSPKYLLNYTFEQYVDVVNLMNKPQNIELGMGTLLLDMSAWVTGNSWGLTGLQNTILNSYLNGSLNLILYSATYDNHLSDIFKGQGESQCEAAFHMNAPSQGSATSCSVLSESQLMDPWAKWIAQGYYGKTFTASNPGEYFNATGFIPIATYSDGHVALGISYNSTTGRMLYIRSPTTEKELPRGLINRAIAWACNAPINSTNPMIEATVFRKTDDSSVAIPMIEENTSTEPYPDSGPTFQTPPVNTTLSLEAPRLGLGNPSNYVMYWLSNPSNSWTPTSWDNISVTLKDGADILVIHPK
jgi:hypothetical protein